MKTFASALLACAATAGEVVLTSWGTDPVTHNFTELNDPVMGGQSFGTWNVYNDNDPKYGAMDGEVKDVPKLQAPGFIKAAADGSFPDASAEIGGDLVLTVRTSTPTYKGFRVSFATGYAAAYSCASGGSMPFSRGCFKAKFDVPSGNTFVKVRIPFNQFSDMWSPSTGDQTTKCADDKSVCPTARTLKNISRLEVWAEGANGVVNLEVNSISAESSASKSVAGIPPAFDTCKAPVQDKLRFAISTRKCQFNCVDADEGLAESVCCDGRNQVYAEPQFLFEAPDVRLFSRMNKTGVNSFYDSVCGIELFKAPIGRTFAEWEAESKEHGWPSFRTQEMNKDNVKFDATTGYVTSACGTHLGSYLPDDKGPRFCLDLACLSGKASSPVFVQ